MTIIATRAAAGALKTQDGQIFTGTSGSASQHPLVQGVLDTVPQTQRRGYHGKCCEPLVSNALNAGRRSCTEPFSEVLSILG